MSARKPTGAAAEAVAAVCRAAGVTEEEFAGPRRTQLLADCRVACCAILSERGMGNREIAAAINRNRSTVAHHLEDVSFKVARIPSIAGIYAGAKRLMGAE